MRPGMYNSIGILLVIMVVQSLLPCAAEGYTESWKWIPFDHSGIRETEFRIIESGKDRIVAEAIFHGMKVDRVTAGGYDFHRINIPGCGSTVETGLPELPVLRKLLAIPAETSCTVRELGAETTVLKNFRIIPSQEPPLRSGPKNHVGFAMNRDAYEKDTVYPKGRIDTADPAILRDHRILPVDIFPLGFHAVRGELEVVRRIILEIDLDDDSPGGGNLKLGNQPRESLVFQPLYEHMIANYEKPGFAGDDAGSGMLIICRDDLIETLTPFARWKSRSGINTELTALSDVAPGGTKEEIAAYIAECYYTWEYPADYVLLVGDVDVIPQWEYGWWIFKVHTDHTYGCVEGDDNLADIIMGRMPVRTAAEAAIMVENAMNYEMDPWRGSDAWYTAAVSMASADGVDPYNGDLFTRVFQDNGFDNVNNLQQNDGTLTNNNVTAALNDGRSWAWYIGHGSTVSWSSISPSFTNSDVRGLVNGRQAPVISSTACLNANIDTGGSCFGDAWMMFKPDGGAAVFHGYTESVAFFTSDTLARYMLYAHFDHGIDSFGAMTDFGRYAVYQYFPGGYLDTVRMCILLGDPTLRPWSRPPALLAASHHGQLEVGESTAAVHVEDGSGDLGNALVTAMNDEVFAAGLTDGSGNVLLDFGDPVEAPAGLAITVVKRNYEPYTAEIPVLPVSGGLVVCEIEPMGSTTIPPGGGVLDFNVTLTSEADLEIPFEAWLEATLPGGESYGILVRQALTLAPGEEISVELHQNVPGSAPAGSYSLDLYSGDEFPRMIWSSDSFGFVKE